MGSLNEDQEESVMSLALLQNKIKRDPEAYREEFKLQMSNFEGLVAALKEQPYRPTRKLQSLAMFLAHTAPCYSVEAEDTWVTGPPEAPKEAPVFDAFAPETFPGQAVGLGAPSEGPSPCAMLKEAMQELLLQTDLHPTTRHALLNSLLLLRSKKMLSCEELLQQALSLLSIKDKFVRQRLMAFVVKDVSKVFAATTNNQARTSLLTRLFALLKSGSSPLPARLALCCLFQVYRHITSKGLTRNSSSSAKIVNAIAALTLAGDARLALSAALFLLGEIQAAAVQASHAIQADEEEGEEAVAAAAAAELQQKSVLHSKKTMAAKRKLKKQKQRMQKRLVRKQQRLEAQQNHWGITASAAILDLIYDAHALADKLFARVRQQRESFSTRVVFLNLVSRLVSHHKVLLLSLYPYLERYLKPSQRLVPSLLAIAANSVHAAVPPDEVKPLLKTIADNFVSDTRGEEVVTLGLNAITEICSRNPHCMTPELLGDLLQYTKHKNSKSVSAAARGLLNLFREIHPTLLPRAFLGKEAAIKLQRDHVSPPVFGASSVSTSLQLLPQLEALKKQSKEELQQLLGGGAEEENTEGESASEDSEAEGQMTDTEANEEEADTQDAEETGSEETEAADSGEEDSEAEEEEETEEEEDIDSEEHQPKPAAGEDETATAAATSGAPTEATAATAANEPEAASGAAAGAIPCGGERLLTDADFAALRLLRAKQLVQQVKGGRRKGGSLEVDTERDQKLLKLLISNQEASSSSSSSEDEDSDEETERNQQEEEFVSERDLEGLAGRKRRRARERGREKEEKLQQKKQRGNKWQPEDGDNANASKPQHVKNRNKPLLMIQQSRRVRQKRLLSVREKAANIKRQIKNLKRSQVGKTRRRRR